MYEGYTMTNKTQNHDAESSDNKSANKDNYGKSQTTPAQDQVKKDKENVRNEVNQ